MGGNGGWHEDMDSAWGVNGGELSELADCTAVIVE